MEVLGEEIKVIPRHVGIIMDGNGRWAQKRFLPRSFGHERGLKRMIQVAERAQQLGVEYLTVYALSTENLSRPKEELDGLYNLFRVYFTKNVSRLCANGTSVKIIGDMTALPEDVAQKLRDAEAKSPKDPSFHLIFAINYGGRAEVIRAVNAAVAAGRMQTQESFKDLLYTSGIPDVDLIIRTGGEKRLSNFLLYQAAYAEFYFTNVLFPDFTKKDLDKAILEYSKRDRRYGKLSAKDSPAGKVNKESKGSK